ncbi:putative 2-aminoethylphosphonate ABC transporter ATP-binding protein [Ideonella sp.]|uniref:putative 2-aminoethylphosphonate ABC transporter ATP-binding protein n=1 Tax=Ideonella sp. TaxID=1929293 RepID=UPI003BB70B1C
MTLSPTSLALELRQIDKRFGAFTALSGINLGIARGEFVCFLGPSGCGKTTLLRIIAGLEVQSDGVLLQAGRDISRLPPAERDYGIVFQSYALFPNLTVADNIAYGLVNRGQGRAERAARVAELLALIGLPEVASRYPAQLSGGQQQRVALARALATSPGLLLLDEPLSALDAIVRVRLRNELRSLQRQLGVTTIMVTHDQEEALATADRIVVMNQGVIEQVGTPLQIYREPASPFVAEFIGKVNRLPAQALGEGWFDCAGLRLQCGQGPAAAAAAGTPVCLFLRPEDLLLQNPEDAPSEPSVMGSLLQLEFLGAHGLAEFHLAELPDRPVQVQFSLQQMAGMNLQPGQVLRLGLRQERLRAFAA